MKPILPFAIPVLMTGIVILTSCHKEVMQLPPDKRPPVARAGADQNIVLRPDSLILDGSASSDPDGRITYYHWSRISGPQSGFILKESAPVTSVKNLVQQTVIQGGVYEFELTVIDNYGLSSKDTVVISVSSVNLPPVAKAGPDQTITLPYTVTLNGSASVDPDYNITTYSWAKIAGPVSGTIVSPTAVQTLVNNLVPGVYQFELTVTDAGNLSSKDTVAITANPCTTIIPDSIYVAQGNPSMIPFGTVSQTRSAMVSASAGNKVLFAGGYTDCDGVYSRVDIFDKGTQTWSTAELSIARYNMVAGAAGNKILFAGGSISSRVDIYDVTTNSWSTAELSMPRSGMATATVGNKIFFAGGYDGYASVSRVDIYDASSNTWTTSNLSTDRAWLAGASVGNKVFFGGGAFGNDDYGYTNSNRVDVYNTSTNSWSIDSLGVARNGLTAIALNNKILFAGGYDDNGETGMVDIYDNSTQSWSVGTLSQPRGYFGAAALGNKVLFFTNHTRMDIYDALSNSWSTADLNVPLWESTIITAGNQAYIAGGRNDNGFANKVWRIQF